MNTTTEKKRFTTRDVMVIAAMMVLTFAVYGAVGALTLPFPFLYLYCAAGIQEFFCATFYLVVANRLNKHGILMVWSTVFHQCLRRLCVSTSVFSAGGCDL